MSKSEILTDAPEFAFTRDEVRQNDDVFEPGIRIEPRPNVLANLWIAERSQDFVDDGLRHDDFEGAMTQESIDDLSWRPSGRMAALT